MSVERGLSSSQWSLWPSAAHSLGVLLLELLPCAQSDYEREAVKNCWSVLKTRALLLELLCAYKDDGHMKLSPNEQALQKFSLLLRRPSAALLGND
jgi:hypothetical protein